MSEIGRRCLLTYLTDFCFGTGTTFASLQNCGRQHSPKEQLKKSRTGTDSRLAFSLNSQLGMSLGPCAFAGFSFDSFSNTAPVETSRASRAIHGGLVKRSDRKSTGSG